MKTKKTLVSLLDEYGIDLSAPTELNHKMIEGLARMYADEGIRLYLENAIKSANKVLIEAMDRDDQVKARYEANRIQLITKLLLTAQDKYKNLSKLKQLNKPDRSAGEIKEEIKL